MKIASLVPERPTVAVLDLATRRVRSLGQEGLWPAWSPDSRTLYLVKPPDTAARSTIKAMPASGGRARTLAYGNDPVTQAFRIGFTVHGGRLYIALLERRGDLWVGPADSVATHINVVTGFGAEVRRLAVPGKN